MANLEVLLSAPRAVFAAGVTPELAVDRDDVHHVGAPTLAAATLRCYGPKYALGRLVLRPPGGLIPKDSRGKLCSRRTELTLDVPFRSTCGVFPGSAVQNRREVERYEPENPGRT